MNELAAYEGLIHATAERYAGFVVDHDLDDIKQILRIKIWQALRAYDATRGTQPPESFVFACMRNRVKDLLKEQDRLNERRQGIQLYVEDAPGHATTAAFELHYLIEDGEVVYAEVEDEPVELPSTLSEREAQVLRLLMQGYGQTEIARELALTRPQVRAAQARLESKMADWRPSSPELAGWSPSPEEREQEQDRELPAAA